MDQTTACADQPSDRSTATNDAIALLKAHFDAGGGSSPPHNVEKALTLLAERCGFEVVDPDEDDDFEPRVRVDEYELDEARARAQRGEVEDALIHLGRALPSQFAIITDRAVDRVRSSR